MFNSKSLFLGYFCAKMPLMPFTMFIDTVNASSIIAVSDVLFLIFSLSVLIVSGTYLTLQQKNNFAFAKVYTIGALYSFLVYVGLTINLDFARLLQSHTSLYFTSYNIDHITAKFLNLLYIFIIIFFLVLYSYIDKKYLRTTFEYPIIVLFSMLGSIILITSTDLFIWFLGIEIQSFCFYTLAGYRTNRSYLQTEAGLKYFLFGSIASSLYLFGTSMIYLFFGTIEFNAISALSYFPLENHYIFQVSIIFILIGLFFKLGVAPFHFWLPLVYGYSSSIVTYLFIILPKIPLLYLLYKFTSLSFASILYLPILLSLFIGTLFAFKETNLKVFFAYSSIANSALFLLPALSQTTYSYYSLIFYLFAYNILLTIAFIPILFLKRSDQTAAFTNLRDLIILKKSNPLLAAFYTLMISSLAGIPPLLGFFSKLFILISALSASSYILIIFVLLCTIISTYYYCRLIKILYFSFSLKYAFISELPLIPALFVSIFSLISLFFCCSPTFVYTILSII